MARHPYQYLHFDMPAVHEIEHSLITEADAIESILANRRHGTDRRPKANRKRVRVASIETLDKPPFQKGQEYDPRIVHLSGHASKEGIEVVGETVRWRELARSLKKWVAHLPEPSRYPSSKNQRVLFLSCCHSAVASRNLKMHLRRHFSGSYFFRNPNPSFQITLAVCTMFYLEFDPHHPHGDDERSDGKTPKLLKRINDFFGEEEGTLIFKPF